MSQIDKYEHAKFIMGRFDHYLNIVNSKGSFYIGLNTFLLGGLFAGITSAYQHMDRPVYLWILLAVFAVCSLVATILTITAINPYLASGNKSSTQRSILFFGSVLEFNKENYEKAFLGQSDDQALQDTIAQNWVLAGGLVSKYKKLKIAGYLLISQFVLLIPIIYFITINLKTK